MKILLANWFHSDNNDQRENLMNLMVMMMQMMLLMVRPLNMTREGCACATCRHLHSRIIAVGSYASGWAVSTSLGLRAAAAASVTSRFWRARRVGAGSSNPQPFSS